MTRVVRVAVLGSGLAGLTTAHLLASRSADDTPGVVFDVHVFERGDAIGLDAATLTLPDGRRIQTPMRAAQGGHYVRLLAMYAQLGVRTQIVDFDYCLHASGRALFLYEGANGLKWPPVSRPSAARRRDFLPFVLVVSLCYLYVTLWAAWHLLRGHYTDLAHPIHRTSLRDWCERRWVSRRFADLILYPLFAALSTVVISDIEQTPAADTLEYIICTFGARHYLSDMSEVVVKLLAPIPEGHVHFSADVALIALSSSNSGGLTLHTRDGRVFEADHVVSCTPSPVAARLSRTLAKSLEVVDATGSGSENARARLLSRFQTRQATVVNHSDARGAQLPTDERNQRLLNLDLPSLASEKRTKHVATTHMLDGTLYQTTNPRAPLDPALVLSEETFERAVTTLDSRRALAELGDFQGANGFWLAGSWATRGIPLLEGCVSSAERVAQGIWQKENVRGVIPW